MVYVFGECELDDQLYQLRRRGKVVELEPKVFDFLAYLICQRDRVVSRNELMEQLWPGQIVSEAALTHCVAKARKAVQDDGSQQQVIKTQHGRGYRFVAEGSMPTDEPPLAVVVRSSDRSVSLSKDRESWFGQTFPPYRQSRLLTVLGVFLVVVSATVV
jgi:DNA-binding winged helix-turn-helix (wHTH) protein